MQLVTAIEEHVAEICSNLAINYVDTLDWRNTLLEEIRRCLEYAEDAAETRPVTGNIDISAAIHAFKQAHISVVITKVDKAANCLSVLCKACYARVSTAELSGPGYKRVESELFPDLRENYDEANYIFAEGTFTDTDGHGQNPRSSKSTQIQVCRKVLYADTG